VVLTSHLHAGHGILKGRDGLTAAAAAAAAMTYVRRAGLIVWA
jgi:hypothetical protein